MTEIPKQEREQEIPTLIDLIKAGGTQFPRYVEHGGKVYDCVNRHDQNCIRMYYLELTTGVKQKYPNRKHRRALRLV